jgi:hypothetical protein
LQKLSAEVLEITPTTAERARVYGRKFTLPFPYLCDADYGVRRVWTEDGVRAHSPLWYASSFVHMLRATSQEAPSDYGSVTPTAREMTRMMLDDDVGFFILDRDGVVRFRMTGSYVDFARGSPRPIPDNDEILHQVALCA